MTHIPKKSLGQNFLINPNVQRRIITSCDLKPADIVLEIGPGKGALTQHIAPLVQQVFAVEKDAQLIPMLNQQFKNSNVTITHDDFLKYSFDSLPDNVKVIGNLPYNIATPIIERVLMNRQKFHALYMTVQLEYGQRIVAKPSTKAYGSLSCFVQYFGDVKMLFKIGRTAFNPVPKVQSCFLKLDISQKPRITINNEKFFFKVVQTAFQQRRKTIVNSLASLCPKIEITEILKTLKINKQLRAENLCLEDYARLAKSILCLPNLQTNVA